MAHLLPNSRRFLYAALHGRPTEMPDALDYSANVEQHSMYAMCFAKKYVNMLVILAVGCILWAMERRDVRCAERKGNSSLVMTLTMGIQMHGNRRYGSLMKPPKCRNTIRVRS